MRVDRVLRRAACAGLPDAVVRGVIGVVQAASGGQSVAGVVGVRGEVGNICQRAAGQVAVLVVGDGFGVESFESVVVVVGGVEGGEFYFLWPGETVAPVDARVVVVAEAGVGMEGALPGAILVEAVEFVGAEVHLL